MDILKVSEKNRTANEIDEQLTDSYNNYTIRITRSCLVDSKLLWADSDKNSRFEHTPRDTSIFTYITIVREDPMFFEKREFDKFLNHAEFGHVI